MREPNFNFANQNKACVCITSQLYDRRALDGPLPTLPLVSSLTHLSFLTSTSPRIREILTLDGGLERLVAIVAGSLDSAARAAAPDAPTINDLHAPSQGGPFRSFASYSKKPASTHPLAGYSDNLLAGPKGSVAYSRSLLITYTLSIQALCNVGVRGTEPVRTRVVEAGVLKVAARVLKSFLDERDKKAGHLADKVKQQCKALRSSTWESGNTIEFSTASPSPSPQDVDQFLLPASSALYVSNQSLSVPSTQPPSRMPSPIGHPPLQQSTSSSNVMIFNNASNDDIAGSSDGDQEREEDELAEDQVEQEAQAIAALVSRGRARSLTVKNDPSAVPSDDSGNRDTEMADDVRGTEGQPMDLDDDLETVIGGHSIAPEQHSPIRETTLLRSPVPTYPLSLNDQASITMSPTASTSGSSSNSFQLAEDGFRFREEEVLTCLQLLAYLSKYPHVRAVFHNPDADYLCASFSACPLPPQAPDDKSSNIFSLVEKFTFRPAPGDRITPRLPTDIQYWAGVIMRNACRKDEARDGVRQCANMQCGEWEKFPREFAKCRRCRKAKYCSKTCQSKAWQGGHRYWCSAKDGVEPNITKIVGERKESRNNPAAPAPRRRPRAMTDPRAANAAVVRAAAAIVQGVSPDLANVRFNEDDAADDIVEEHQDAGVEIAEIGGGGAEDMLRRIASEGVEEDLL